jgi:hypothetical protein
VIIKESQRTQFLKSRRVYNLTFNELKKYDNGEVVTHSRYFYRPGMKYAMLSRILFSNSCGQPFVSGTCWVKHIKGPRAHSSESSSTDKLPDTAI